MPIPGYTEESFGARLAEIVNASNPVRSVEHLKGRDENLADIKRALYAPGRHIFVYGDRGVGKSSLAATAAVQYQGDGPPPIFVSGALDANFRSIIASIAIKATESSKLRSTKSKREFSIEFHGIKWSRSQEINPLNLADQIQTISDAAELLRQVANSYSDKTAVVLDEFDTIPDQAERGKFASLLKQIGDQSINIKFLITGVGQSCEELLGAHQSAHRQLATFELLTLPFEGRRQIVQDAVNEIGLEVNDDVNWRIALISAGYPYYIHLITEKMLWAAFDSTESVTTVGWNEFHVGLRKAIIQTNAELKAPYEKAVLQRKPEFEDVVWSTADGDDLFRSLDDMAASYKSIIQKRINRPELDRPKYSEIVRKLRDRAYGPILKSVKGRQGWYEYCEKMLRGYVRMQAEANEVVLSGEMPAPRQVMHTGNSRTGSHGPSIPVGVNQREPIRRSDK